MKSQLRQIQRRWREIGPPEYWIIAGAATEDGNFSVFYAEDNATASSHARHRAALCCSPSVGRGEMALILSCQSLGKSFGARLLFEDISLEILDGERLGLIGPNGSGKSTLLRILADELEADSGSCTRRKGLRVGYLPQEDVFPAGATVQQVLASPGRGADRGVSTADPGLDHAGQVRL